MRGADFLGASMRYALLVDGGFICKRLRSKSRQVVSADEVLDECRRVASHRALVGADLLRIYYYDAPPATRCLTNPISGRSTNLGRTPQHKQATAFQDRIELSANVALRLGDLAVRGWRVKSTALKEIAKSPRLLKDTDLVPHIEQKGVDLRIGLDIARLSLRELVGALVVVTGDSDIIPAFKFARREGVRVYLHSMGAPVKRDLRAHVDQVLS